jgi:hypothetical protein
VANEYIYNDISVRTQGDIYIGVVGPVRTGKSTFIKKFMDTLVIPRIDDDFQKERARDELPQSAAGRTIMTTEPKFIPEDAIELSMDDNLHFKVRLIDCVGYIVPSSVGYIEKSNREWYTRRGLRKKYLSIWRQKSARKRLLRIIQQSGSLSLPTAQSAQFRVKNMKKRKKESSTN